MGIGDRYDEIMQTLENAVTSGPQWLGKWIAPEGEIDLYVTTEKPANYTEQAHRLRMPLPPRV